MVKSSHPVKRLKFLKPGDEVELFGDYLKRSFVVTKFREDGYVELSRNGRIEVTASKDHEIR